jgi:archaellum biogenesis ATPase FlaH
MSTITGGPMKIEQVIFNNLLYNEDFARKSLPHLKQEYFSDFIENKIYSTIEKYVGEYNKIPSKEAIIIDLSNAKGITDEQFAKAKTYIQDINEPERQDIDWLVNQTEKFCQDKAIYNAIVNSIKILDGDNTNLSKGSIPGLLTDALSVSFDTSIGHDFLENADARYDYYHTKQHKIPFDLEYMNKITKGGLPRKTLNVFLAGTGVGKSLFMCHCAANNLMNGLNVLYITLEMAEQEIAKRVDANLLNVTMGELEELSKESYVKMMDRLRGKTKGKFIVKEYPTASAGAANFRHLLNELKLKKNFVPDVVYVDYLNLCTSSRIKGGSNVNSYTMIKSIAEELRGLAVEFNIPLISATQTTRSGYGNSDVEITDTSESFGLPATCDFMAALIVSEELDQLGQIMVKQLKNRYNDPSYYKRFVVGIDRARMKLYDVEKAAQDLMDDSPVMDNTPSGDKPSKFDRNKFKDFK